MKKIFKVLIVFIALIASILFMADNIEEWAYEKFGKEKVRDYMKKFEPYIVLSDDEDEADEEEVEQEVPIEDAIEEYEKASE